MINMSIRETYLFQFTTSQGGRLRRHMKNEEDILFQFTTSQGGRRDRINHNFAFIKAFNSRPHKEVDRSRRTLYRGYQPFNSRPHKEVDIPLPRPEAGSFLFQFTTSQGGRRRLPKVFSITKLLSIHDLTRRSTIVDNRFFQPAGLSIHDLTRRSTEYSLRRRRSCDLSIHDLTRRSTCHAPLSAVPKAFQFTTSQGGRRSRWRSGCRKNLFQFTTSQGGRQIYLLRIRL